MTTETDLNLDTSVLFDYLYGTLLPNRTNGDAEFVDDGGSRVFFESSSVFVVAGGKACGEFNNRCEHRQILYDDIVDFIEETGQSIIEYDPETRSIYTNPHDKTHFKWEVRTGVLDQPIEGQLSTMRRCHQQIDKCREYILESALDDTFDQFQDGALRDAIQDELDIDHDCEIVVDAAYICRNHSIGVLVSTDSDITKNKHREKISEIIEREFDSSIELTIIQPWEHSLN